MSRMKCESIVNERGLGFGARCAGLSLQGAVTTFGNRPILGARLSAGKRRSGWSATVIKWQWKMPATFTLFAGSAAPSMPDCADN